jgi:hypothetical protein
MPGAVWYLTMVVGIGAIAVSAAVVIFMKMKEIDAKQVRLQTERRTNPTNRTPNA